MSLNDGATGTGNDQFDYQGTWLTSTAAGKYQGDDHYSSTTGDTVTVRFDGFAAWVVWLVVHLFYLVGFQNRALVVLRWTISFLTHGRGARLIKAPH